MLDKILAVTSLLCLIGFVAILVYYVREPDLTIVIVIVMVMAIYDFYLLTKPKSNAKEQERLRH